MEVDYKTVLGLQIHTSTYQAVVECLRHGDILMAVKYIRSDCSAGLKESKDAADAIAADNGITGPWMAEYQLVRDLHAIHQGYAEGSNIASQEAYEDHWFGGRRDFYVRQGLVTNTDGSYRLTPQGHALIERIFSRTRLPNQTIDFATCFLSHSTRDREFVEHLYQQLEETGVRVWYAPHDLEPGEHLDKQLANAIRVNDRVILVLSRFSMRSKWVLQEILAARRREREEQRKILFPISLVSHKILTEWKCMDPDSGEDLALEIRRYFIPQFVRWRDEKRFNPLFEKMVAGLSRLSDHQVTRGGTG